ncbi:MAG: SHOCT domain-containing protein [Methylococcales bacterium]|nr:SHOCT domain-containing protein [Methylococcales bacterium]
MSPIIKKLNYIFIIVLIQLTGCADVRLVQQQILQLKNQPPKCFSQIECNAMMEAAQVWLSNNSLLKIQTATSAIIQTYSDINSHCYPSSYIVEKVPIRTNEWKITLDSSCEGSDYIKELNSFNSFISITLDSKYGNTENPNEKVITLEKDIKSNIHIKNKDNIPDQLKKLKELKDADLLTNSEYESKRKVLIDKL